MVGVTITIMRLICLFSILVTSLLISGPLFSYEARENTRLDQLFSALKQADSSDEADKIASQINILWRNAKGHTASLLLSRADEAHDRRKLFASA